MAMMKRAIGLIAIAMLTAAPPASGGETSPFSDAVAVWHMADASDSSSRPDALTVRGDVKPGVLLNGREREDSLRRGGDGRVAVFEGGYLDAGQGVDGKLNFGGNAMSMLLRLRSPTGKWGDPLMAKHGGHDKEVYNIFTCDLGAGVAFGAELGSDEVAGMHQVSTPISTLGPADWHDIIVRWDGNVLQLFVDGALRDDASAVGVLRQGNREPLLIGAESVSGQVKSGFRGLVDHAAIWSRALSDAEIARLSGVETLGDKRPAYYAERLRPQFHFTARKHWINDPNGLVYYDGVYHMCFQHQPPGRPGAYKDWGHAVSTDLVHWKQLPSALVPHRVWGGCWSGSAVVDVHNTSGFQSGNDKPIVAILTNGGTPGQGPLCTQCIAFSTDAGKTFSYYQQNPVLGNVVGCNRDPKVIWHDPTKKWIMALYLDGNDYALFASPDLKAWEKLCVVNLPGVSECPDLFPLAVAGEPSLTKWIFWGASGNYLIGSFDGRTFKSESELLRADFGANFYAAQTWSDIPPADGRRIQVAWMAGGNYPGMPFTQQLSFPTEVTLRRTPAGLRMYRVPVREIEKLHLPARKWSDAVIKPGDNLFSELKGELFDIRAEIEPGRAQSIVLCVRGESIRYDVASETVSCLGRSAPLKLQNGRVSLQVLADRTSLEVFGNDGASVLSSCFLPPDENQSVVLETLGTEAKVVSVVVYPMKSIWQ